MKKVYTKPTMQMVKMGVNEQIAACEGFAMSGDFCNLTEQEWLRAMYDKLTQ